MQLSVDRLVGEQHVARQGPKLPMQDGVVLAHRLQIAHKRKRIGVLDDDVLHVDSLHLEARLGEEAADVAHVRERRDVRADAAAAFEVSELQRRAQLEERVAAEHGGYEGGVGLEDGVDLGEEGREVVDPVDGEGGEHGVEGGGFEGEGFEVGDDLAGEGELAVEGLVGVAVEERFRGVDAGQVSDFVGERGGGRRRGVGVGHCEGSGDVAAVGAEVEDVGKVSFDVLCRFC